MKLFFYSILSLISVIQCYQKPNIVMIVLDDLGRNDIGLHGSAQIPTPNLDAIFMNGVTLEKFYTLPSCTPTRAALLTGQYTIRSGLQGLPIAAGQPRYLPTSFPTMADTFKSLGYSTHLVGKWHLGSKYQEVTPTFRGFDSHFGYWNGFCGYKTFEIQDRPDSYNGFDLHNNFVPAYEYKNQVYATDLFTDKAIDLIENHDQTGHPLFLLLSHLAPHTGQNGLLETKDDVAARLKYSYIVNPERRLYADIVNYVDASIGKVFTSLQETGMLDNTIVVVMSDNGAQTYGVFENFGSNWPLRGQKLSLSEGGIRNVAAVYSTKLTRKKSVENNLIHVSDLYPTLVEAAGGDVTSLGSLDGISQWSLLSTGIAANTRNNLLLNYDDSVPYGAIMTGDGRYKLTKGNYQKGFFDTHSGDSGRGPADPKYDTSAVINSPANKAILAATNNAAPLTEAEINAIRSQVNIPTDDRSTLLALACSYFNGYCLFDLQNDPRELNDIKFVQPTVFNNLKNSLDKYILITEPQGDTNIDPASDPAHCNNTWFTWGETDPALKCANYVA